MSAKRKYIDTALIAIHPKSGDYYMEPSAKESVYNNTLIALRKKFRQVTDSNKQLAFKLLHLNKMVKAKYEDDIVNIIKMYLREDDFDLATQVPSRPEISEEEKQRLLREGRVMMAKHRESK